MADVVGAFKKYREYLEINMDKFPKKAYEQATSDWFYNFNDNKCPHDSWLESISIIEPSSGDRSEVRNTEIQIKLLGAYHDGCIEITYPEVYSYQLTTFDVKDGHKDWRHDESRLSDEGNLIHEIEWCGFKDIARWIIIAKDIEYKWVPK